MFKLEGIDHVALVVTDVARSIAWYQKVLGLHRAHEEVWGTCPAIVGVGTTSLALFQAEGFTPTPCPRNAIAMRHLAFRATRANYERACEELEQQGIAFERQDHSISHSIYIHDPDGHEIEITTYEV